MRTRFSTLGVMLTALCTDVVPLSCRDCFSEDLATPSKDVVVRHVREYLSAIESIHLRFDHWTTMWPDEKKHEGECGPQTIEWAEQGPMKLLKHGNFPQEGQPPMVSFFSFDGRLGYYVDYVPGSATEVRSVHQTPQINQSYEALLSTTPAVFYGYRFPSCDGGLLDFISAADTVVVGRETIDGASCVHLQSLRHKGAGGTELKADAWLDDNMDWLPRRLIVRYLPSNQNVSPRFRDVDKRYEVARFIEVEDPLLGRKKKFPGEMRHTRIDGGWRLRIQEASINKRLNEASFRPEMPNGTLVYDGEQAPLTPVKTFVVGGSNVVSQMIDRRVAEAAKLPPPSVGATVDANKETSIKWSFVIGVCSGLLLIIAAAWTVYSRMKKS